MRIKLFIITCQNKRYNIQIIQVYAPTSSSENEEVEQLNEDIARAKNKEFARLVVIGDFNAKVGQNTVERIQNVGNVELGQRNH